MRPAGAGAGSAGSADSRSTARCRSAVAAVRVGAELVAQPAGQGVVRREGGRRPARRDRRAHQVADRPLVERVGQHRLGGDRGRPGRLDGRQRRRQQVAGAAAQAVGLPAHAAHPVGVRLVDERRLGAEQVEGATAAGRDEAVLARGQPGRRPRRARRGRLVEVDRPAAARRAARRHGRSPASTPSPSSRRVRLTSVETFAAGSAGGSSAQSTSTIRSSGHQPAALGGQQGEQGAGLAAAQLAPGQAAARAIDTRSRRRAGSGPERPCSAVSAAAGGTGQHSAVHRWPSLDVEGCRWRPADWSDGGQELLGGRRGRTCWRSSASPPAPGSRPPSPQPTPAQVGAWQAISAGRNALVVAPTGSGKTLLGVPVVARPAGDLAAAAEKKHRCRVLYVSPLKALAVDVERNLRAPLTGIRHTSDRLGVPAPDITVGLRSGDTTAADRRRLGTTPPDILITTPESLFLMLTSQARETLRGVETVIVDEVHAVAGTKRGAHLALSLERLDELLRQDPSRRSASACPRPCGRSRRSPGSSAAPGRSRSSPRPRTKQWDLKVVVPVEDMTELALAAAVDELRRAPPPAAPSAAGRSGRTSRSGSST